jgi:hypothetical protein
MVVCYGQAWRSAPSLQRQAIDAQDAQACLCLSITSILEHEAQAAQACSGLSIVKQPDQGIL